jgi:hypothetical protein
MTEAHEELIYKRRQMSEISQVFVYSCKTNENLTAITTNHYTIGKSLWICRHFFWKSDSKTLKNKKQNLDVLTCCKKIAKE